MEKFKNSPITELSFANLQTKPTQIMCYLSFIATQESVPLDDLIKRVKDRRGSRSFVYTAAAFIIFYRNLK